MKDINGSKNPNWKGGISKHSRGYVKFRKPEHPRSDSAGYVLEHILIAEKALGKLLPVKSQVHHLDFSKSNNKNKNLVICEDSAYHMLLHKRQRALKNFGNVDAIKCSFCKTWGLVGQNGLKASNRHVQCVRDYDKIRWSRKTR